MAATAALLLVSVSATAGDYWNCHPTCSTVATNAANDAKNSAKQQGYNSCNQYQNNNDRYACYASVDSYANNTVYPQVYSSVYYSCMSSC